MNWICATMMICLSFNPVMDYTNNKEFINSIILSREISEHKIVTFGIKPEEPDINFGYIKKGKIQNKTKKRRFRLLATTKHRFLSEKIHLKNTP